jgi:Flp pilus assembly protein TadG
MLANLTDSFLSRQTPRRLRRLKRASGATIVEFALVFIILITMLFGIAGFGHMLYAYHFANHAAKEATRWAMVNGATCNNDAAFSSNAKGSCTAPVTCSAGSCSTCSSGCASATSTDISNYVQIMTPPGIDPSKIATSACGVSDTPACSDSLPDICSEAITGVAGSPFPNYPSCTVQVKVAYALTFIFPLLPTNTATTAPCTKPGFCISSTSEMVIAH